MADKTHIYNLKAVINEVGLTPATLRAWERRYGLLKPQRSLGGHRLYSRQDIEMLKWLVERQREGLSISRAAEMWKSQQGDFREVLQQLQAPVSVTGVAGTLIDELRNSWLSACFAFDDQAANRTLDQALAIAAPEMICTEILQKGLAKIGDNWYAGSASVQHEHFASAIAIRRVNALMAAVVPPNRPGRILLACPPGEAHGFILLLVTFLLRRQGWEVVYLGEDVPFSNLDVTLKSVTPTLIIAAAQTLPSAASLRLMSETVGRYGVPLAYGGGIFTHIPDATLSITGYYLGDEVSNTPKVVERLTTAPPSMPVARTLTAEYSMVVTAFNQSEAQILAFAVSALQARQLDSRYLELANANLPPFIVAALRLGDIDFLDHSIAWLNGLLKSFGISTDETLEIYSAYSLAIERYLGGDGAIIHDWLAKHMLSARMGV